MHCKQYLNSFHEINELLKKFANDKLENNKIESMCNNLNVSPVAEDIDKTDPIRHAWEVNNHSEKGMQPNKENFVSQKGNFAEILLKKSHAKKVLDYLSPDKPIDFETGSQFQNYAIDSRDTLNTKLQNAVPMPFVIIKDGNLFFVF